MTETPNPEPTQVQPQKLRLRLRSSAVWTRQPGEPEDAFLAFISFRDQTPPRTRRRVHIHNMCPPSSHVAAWANAWRWEDRVLAYDQHFDEASIQAQERMAIQIGRELGTRHAVVLHRAFEVMAREVDKYNRDSLQSQNAIFAPHEMIRFMQKVIELQRLTNGQSTASVAIGPSEIDNLPIEVVAEMDALMRRAGVKT